MVLLASVSNVKYIIHTKHQKYLDAYGWIMEKRFLRPHQRFECSHWQGFLLNVDLEEARGIFGKDLEVLQMSLAGRSRSDSRQRNDVQTKDLAPRWGGDLG